MSDFSDPDDDFGSNDDFGVDRPVPDPMDRLWRHPSELTGQSKVAGPPHPASRQRPLPARPSRRSNRVRRSLTIPAASAFAGAGVTLLLVTAFGSVDFNQAATLDATPDEPTASEASQVVTQLAPSIVAITARDDTGLRRGSGIVVRPDGEVLTNARLIGDATTVDVLTIDGTRITAEIVGIDVPADLALVRISSPLIAAPVSTSMPGIGQPIYAVAANRSGRATPRVSRGIVSSTDGLVATRNGPAMSGLIEIDTLADAEWAGGALVDEHGETLGILFAPTVESRRTFALPMRYATEIAARLRVDGVADHGRLGFVGVDTKDGPVVWSVDADAAAHRLRPGDVVLVVDDRRVDTMAEVTAVVRRSWPGDRVALEVRRGDRVLRMHVELGTDQHAPQPPPPD